MAVEKNIDEKAEMPNEKVVHDYHDYASEVEKVAERAEDQHYMDEHTQPNQGEENFPVKLHYMLTELETDGMDDVVSWQPHGRCFLVHKQQQFVEKVLPLWFRQTKFPSFQRQLNLYGFKRITSGRDKGGYYHELFLRSKRFLSQRIQRIKIKGLGARKPSSPETEPNFYNAAYLPSTRTPSKNPWIASVSNMAHMGPNMNVGTGGEGALQRLLAYPTVAASFQQQQRAQLALPPRFTLDDIMRLQELQAPNTNAGNGGSLQLQQLLTSPALAAHLQQQQQQQQQQQLGPSPLLNNITSLLELRAQVHLDQLRTAPVPMHQDTHGRASFLQHSIPMVSGHQDESAAVLAMALSHAKQQDQAAYGGLAGFWRGGAIG